MKRFKAVSSLALSAAMAFSLAAPVFAAQEGTQNKIIEGEGTDLPVVYNIEVPTKVEFSFDGLGQKDNLNQIFSAETVIVNRTNIPVRLGYTMKVIPATGVTIVAGTQKAEENVFGPVDAGATDKKIKFGVVGALKVTDVTYASSAGAKTVYDTTAFDAVYAAKDCDTKAAKTIKYAEVPESGKDFGKLSFGFIMDKATINEVTPENSTLATKNSCAAFKYFGMFNTYASDSWKKGDLKVYGAFKMEGLRPETWAAMTKTETNPDFKDTTGGAGNMVAFTWVDPDTVVTAPVDPPTPAEPGFAAASYNVTKGTDVTTSFVLPENSTISSITVGGGWGYPLATLVADTDYTYNSTTKAFVLKSGAGTKVEALKAGTTKLTLKTSENVEFKVDIVIAA